VIASLRIPLCVVASLVLAACGTEVPSPQAPEIIEPTTTTSAAPTTTTTTTVPPVTTTEAPPPPAPPKPKPPVVTTTKAPAPPPKKAAPAPAGNCHPAYPTVCIPPSPPDLDCPDIPYRDFDVRNPDPHRFDADHDGIGCES
jgi:hypothetical protein